MKALLFLWQFPQHLFALLVWGALRTAGRVVRTERDGAPPGNVFITVRARGWGVSLGRYIFLDAGYGGETRKHERGHSWQSRIFGPLYLLVIGIASAVFNNLWDRVFHTGWAADRRTAWYYGRFPEAWADRLGGVRRGGHDGSD
ncbi:MAG: hypothetical protein LBK02_08990 [Treponema sp.]|jgi:hypothetical protein|nr:hypothetical protein [Treponema sp.]